MKKTIIALVLTCTMLTVGCTAAWLTTFDSWLAIAAPVIVDILDIAALAKGVPVNPATVAKVNGDAKALQVLVASIQSADSANLPNACAAFNQGLATFVADVPTLEQIGQISNPTTEAQITDALTLVQSTVSELEIPIASCATSGASKATLAAVSRVKSPSDFAGQYNAIMKRQASTKKYQVHVHSKFVRVLSFGVAK
jgi:hypothetical protein